MITSHARLLVQGKNMTENILSLIRKPILKTSLSCHYHQGVLLQNQLEPSLISGCIPGRLKLTVVVANKYGNYETLHWIKNFTKPS